MPRPKTIRMQFTDRDINSILDQYLLEEEDDDLKEEQSANHRKLHTLQILYRAEHKNKIFEEKMDRICGWLCNEFLPPNSESIEDALKKIKDTFKSPRKDIPLYFEQNCTESASFFGDFSKHFLSFMEKNEFYSKQECIYEIIYEIVCKMIYIESISDNYPMIVMPMSWSKNLHRDFLRCFGVPLDMNHSRGFTPKHIREQSNRSEESKESDDENNDESDDEERKRKRFLDQFRLKFKAVRKLNKKKTKSCPKCCGCGNEIEEEYITVYCRFMDEDDVNDTFFCNEDCVLLRKYKEAIRQYIFEYELKEKTSSSDRKLSIPDLGDDKRLFYLYRDRMMIISLASQKNGLPKPSEQTLRRKRQLAAHHLYREYEMEIHEKWQKDPLNFEKYELLRYIDFKLYGIALWRFCVKQLEIKSRSGLWNLMNYLARNLPTLSILKELEEGKDSFKRFGVGNLSKLCQTVIQNSKFPAATALYLAAFMQQRGEEDESRAEEFLEVKTLFVDIAKELLNKIESDHLLAIRLELPTDINYLTILDVALKFELDDFLEFHRLQPIFFNLWREFEYLSPCRPFHTRNAESYEIWFLLLRHPNRFYFTPMGLFLIEFSAYIFYLLVFTIYILKQTYPYHEPPLEEYILWIFNAGFILYEIQEMSFRKGEYFADLSNYWDVLISITWLILFGMRIYSVHAESDWVVYFPNSNKINEIETRSTQFFLVYTCLMAIQCILLWTRLLSKLQRSNYLAPLIQMIIDMVSDVIKFGVLLGIFVVAFIFALHYVIAGDLNHAKRYQEWKELNPDLAALYDLDEDDLEYTPPLDTFRSIFLYVAQTLFGQQEWELIESDHESGPVFFNEPRSRVVDMLILVFTVLGSILLMNLLIALMASTYERVRHKSYIRVNFFRSLNTHEIVKRTALMPPPLNILVLAVTICWLLSEALIEFFTCCTYTFSVERLSPLGYSLRRQRSKQLRRYSKLEHSFDEEDDDEEEQLHNAEAYPMSRTLSTESDAVDGRYITYDGLMNNVHFELEQEQDYDQDLSMAARTNSSYEKHIEYRDVEKCCLFERLPRGSCRRSFCCEDKEDIPSKNSKRYCRYCRNDMRDSTSGDIDDYFDLFRYHGQILDEADIKEMKHLCEDWDYVHLCPHCFRPYILWNRQDSNRHSRFQIMLEIISFYVFMIVVWLPLSIVMIVPAFIVWVYSECKGFTKPKAFTREDELANISLNDRYRQNKNVKDVIKETIREKKSTGDFRYTQLTPKTDDEAGCDVSNDS